MKKLTLSLLLFVLLCPWLQAEDGYRLWLRYDKVQDEQQLKTYRSQVRELIFPATSQTAMAAREELKEGLSGLLGFTLPEKSSVTQDGALLVGTPTSSRAIARLASNETLKKLGPEGYLLKSGKVNGKNVTVVTANTDQGLLYGVFALLKRIQIHQSLSSLSVEETPALKVRVLNHWDNLDRTVERGYAGFSLWDWHRLPDYLDPRYKDYARANASIGINGTVLTNVNANAQVLTKEYLQKVAALASVFRPYGIKVYLTARFSAPIEIGGLKTADPLNAEVRLWWKKKADEIYTYIPDFGGFLVKANSEGQPGPQNYGRNHADGANMLADALAPHKGIVMWRAFVYDNNVPEDRAKQAYNEFKPLDGQFRENVMVQVKNGAIDFQPREPFHPLFGAMPKTPLAMEFQITQEYLGFATHLAYLAPMYEETLKSDTYARGKGSTVAKVIDGSLEDKSLTGMAGVANIGNDINWTGHPFGQSNWYAFGRLAWDPEAKSEDIAADWLRMTFNNQASFIKAAQSMMMMSREAVVNYMTPLGLHHLMGWSHHYGPGPWIKDKPRADWTSVYYHKADSFGIGFNRTSTGSKALSQYFGPVQEKFENISTCPEEFLLWFHHVSWDHKMKSGRTLWEELCFKYNQGVNQVEQMQALWTQQQGKVDKTRYEQVKSFLAIQNKEAKWWRDACLLYFQQFSKRPIPAQYPKPAHTLEYYQNLEFQFVPGI
ncbi:alpha-glucuronidase family glycosyl hydrolase [Pedobacter sp. SYSU D00535]|uniref:alpha-glucuronidase family glycosyl hydrolase n=1 Tax=Pedobacter sp. SYSU D00535 TaxID=2810308 RepID=UPI001A961B9D|nr:alpha-glucuronidase family glycosyl hydrolase [Pedobacter sp. SYSU D00535]